MDRFLETEGSQGTFQSEGWFTVDLQKAGRKLAEHGLGDPDLWTLKLAQAFSLLGCKSVQVRLSKQEWSFRIDAKARKFNPADFQKTTTDLSTSTCSSAEQHFAAAIAALSHGKDRAKLIGAEWNDGESVTTILGKARDLNSSEQFRGLVLTFGPGSHSWNFPLTLWAERLCYSPVEFWNLTSQMMRSKPSVLNHASTSTLIKKRQGTALEQFFSDPSDLGFVFRPLGQALCDLTGTIPPKHSPLTTIVRVTADQAIGHGNLIVLVRDSEKRISSIQALKDGCLLEKQKMPSFPRGFEIIFQADDCPTDLSQMRLRESPEFAKKQVMCLDKMLISLRYMANSIDTDMTHIAKPKTPLIARITAITGLGIGGSLSLVCLLFASPLAAAICSVIWAPSGFLHLFSKHSRKMEFQQAKMDGMALLRSRITNLESVIRNWDRSSPQRGE